MATCVTTCGSQARRTDEATPRRGSRLPPAVCLQVRFLPTPGHLSSTRRRIQVRQQDSQQDAFPAVASGGDLLTFPPFRAPQTRLHHVPLAFRLCFAVKTAGLVAKLHAPHGHSGTLPNGRWECRAGHGSPSPGGGQAEAETGAARPER